MDCLTVKSFPDRQTCLDHRKYLWCANLAPFMLVLELIMRFISSVHFAVAGSKGFLG